MPETIGKASQSGLGMAIFGSMILKPRRGAPGRSVRPISLPIA